LIVFQAQYWTLCD